MLMTLMPAYRISQHLFCRQKCRSLHISARCVAKMKTYYEVLNVDNTATPEQIRAAYVKKSKELHPDLNPNKPRTHEKFIQMTNAYNTLIKETSRKDYDLSLSAFLEKERRFRSTHSSHTSSRSSRRPGSGFYQPEADEQVFWDETIWSMRDKSKDRDFKDKAYYGLKGLRRQPNSYILVGVFVWILIGCAIHFLLLSKAQNYAKNAHDERDIKFHNFYMERRAKAKLHGNELQMQLLKDQYVSENGEP